MKDDHFDHQSAIDDCGPMRFVLSPPFPVSISQDLRDLAAQKDLEGDFQSVHAEKEVSDESH